MLRGHRLRMLRCQFKQTPRWPKDTRIFGGVLDQGLGAQYAYDNRAFAYEKLGETGKAKEDRAKAKELK